MGGTEWISDCGKARLILGDCLERLKELPDCSVDSVVTDPPYGLAFMGKKWDYDVPIVEVWAECLRVLKPGGHLLAFAGTRTQHRMAVRIEDAGFEIRDMIAWVYGSGFPKSLDVSKAIDRAAGVEREVVPATGGLHKNRNMNDDGWAKIGCDNATMWGSTPATEAARQWQGFGTALKPAMEPITVARKPLIGNVAENVLRHGTGAINVDGCRVACDWQDERGDAWLRSGKQVTPDLWQGPAKKQAGSTCADRVSPLGRWPANLIHDGSDEVVGVFPSPHGAGAKREGGQVKHGDHSSMFGIDGHDSNGMRYGDSGSAARFFYCAKASKADRDEGLDAFEVKPAFSSLNTKNGTSERLDGNPTAKRANVHPTVKPVALMRYLCRLVTPPGGIVLDPFMGSGSTGKGAILEGFRFIGIEREAEYLEIAKARIAYAIANYSPPEDKPEQLTLLPE